MSGVILAILLVFVAMIFFMVRLLPKLWVGWTENSLNEKFCITQQITDTGRIPRQWIPGEHRFRKQDVRSDGGRSAPDAAVKHLILRRLDSLTRFFAKCPYFETPDDREYLLDCLAGIRQSWQDGDWRERVEEGINDVRNLAIR